MKPSVLISFILTGILSANVQAAQYELAAEDSIRSLDDLLSLDVYSKPAYLPAKNFKKKKPEVASLKIDMNFLDQEADYLSSPQHSFNAAQKNTLNHTSNEFKTSLGYRFDYLTPEAALKYSPDSYGLGEYYNYELGVSVPVNRIFSLETRYGWNQFDKQAEQGGVNNYQDWSVGVSTTYRGMKLKVDYFDVNMNESDKSETCGKLFPCEGKAVFSIIKNF